MERPTRERLLDAVMRLSGEQGFAQLSISAVLARVGRGNHRTFYRHFESLEAAFVEGYEQVFGEILDASLAAGRRSANWRQGFRLALRSVLHWVVAEPVLARAILCEYPACGERAWKARERVCERIAAAMEDALDGQQRRKVPPHASAGLIGGIEFIFADRTRGGDAASILELESGLAYLAVALYFGPDTAQLELQD